MNYRSIQDLNQSITANLFKVPEKTDLIVGVPRSGLLAANLLALQLNLPFTDVEGFIHGKILQSGHRMKSYMKPFHEYKNILVIEDSVNSGTSVKEVKGKIANLYPEKEILFTAVFVSPKSKEKVDFYLDICPTPRIFEWNLMHHDHLENCCVTIEGVLCRVPTDKENNSPAGYENYISNAKALNRPSKTIGCLVTTRPEKYRILTENWLSQHNIKYKHLFMPSFRGNEIKNRANYVDFKTSVYIKNDCVLYIEGNLTESIQIADRSGMPVSGIEARKMIKPKLTAQTTSLMRKIIRKLRVFKNRFNQQRKLEESIL